MPKTKPEPSDFERELVALLDAAAPGSIELSRTGSIFDDKRDGFRIRASTRATSCDYLDENLRECVAVVVHDLREPEDPIRPAWHRIGRLQREVVTRLLDAEVAKHMGRAARARLGADGNAHAEYEIADAFAAALTELRADTFDYGEDGERLAGTPALAAEGPPEPIHIAKPRKSMKHTPPHRPQG